MHTLFSAPSATPSAVHVIPGSVSSMGFLVAWDEPQLEHQNGIIDHYVISVIETETDNATLYTSVSLTFTLQNLHPFYNYELSIAAFTVGMGPFSQAINVTTDQEGKSATHTFIVYFGMKK